MYSRAPDLAFPLVCPSPSWLRSQGGPLSNSVTPRGGRFLQVMLPRKRVPQTAGLRGQAGVSVQEALLEPVTQHGDRRPQSLVQWLAPPRAVNVCIGWWVTSFGQVAVLTVPGAQFPSLIKHVLSLVGVKHCGGSVSECSLSMGAETGAQTS